MLSSDSTGDSAVRTASQFATTHWSVVLAAGDSESPEAQGALEKLCQTYWLPLYTFVRRNGYGPEDAQDLTQAFFERFLKNKTIRNLAPEKGRLRNFLLTVLKRFLRDQHDRAVTAKRGGGVPLIPLDTVEAEAQIQVASSSNSSPDHAFDRAWAETVLQGGVERLRAQYETEGRAALFAKLSPYLTRPADRSGYAGSVEPLNMDANTVAAEVFRLRRRYRELVRAEVANTVATPAEIDSEMGYLVELLAK
jgi:RNA polymerase sigma-70 factor (ECF subfamily)